jgi:hypothetical protein
VVFPDECPWTISPILHFAVDRFQPSVAVVGVAEDRENTAEDSNRGRQSQLILPFRYSNGPVCRFR